MKLWPGRRASGFGTNTNIKREEERRRTIFTRRAALLGAVAVEAHITLDRAMYGSDQAASLEKTGLEKLVDYCKLAEVVVGDGVKTMTEKEKVNAAKMRYWEWMTMKERN